MNDNFCTSCVFSALLEKKQSVKLSEKPVNLKSVIFKNIACNTAGLGENEKKLYCVNEKNASKDFTTGERIPVLCDSLNYYGECLFHKTQEELDKEQEDEKQNDTSKEEPVESPDKTTEETKDSSKTADEISEDSTEHSDIKK